MNVLRMARIFLYERMGKVDASIRELRALLAERPGDAVVQNALGYTLADHTRHVIWFGPSEELDLSIFG